MTDVERGETSLADAEDSSREGTASALFGAELFCSTLVLRRGMSKVGTKPGISPEQLEAK
jgi:hypothetical protein